MSHPLEQRVRAVARSAAWLVGLYGLCRSFAALVAALLALALLDATLRLEQPLWRWGLSLAAVGGAVLICWRWLLPVRHSASDRIAAARRIERHFPALGERLSSAIAFLGQREEDATAGSASLRRAVIAEAEALASGLDFSKVLDRRPTRRAATAALGVCALGAVLAGFMPATASLAVSRLALPWRDQPWPRRHELAFVDPPVRLAAGSDLELVVVDQRGRLPEEVELQLRRGGMDGKRVETRTMSHLGERMVYRLDNVAESFAYRARGGDDDTMPWREVQVIEPPQVWELTIEVTPPEYTQLPVRTEGPIVQALAGSALRIRGRLDKPISQARLQSETPGQALPEVAIGADGTSFVAPPPGKTWRPEKSAAVWLRMTDSEGVAFGHDTRVEVRLTADAPPTIEWQTPSDHAFATPRSVVPVQALVKDDLAVRSAQLRYMRPGSSDVEQVVPLLSEGMKSEGRETRPIDVAWDLSSLAGVAAGDVLAVRLTADDDLPQLTTTSVRRLTIVTEAEMEARLAQRQTAILGQLTQALEHARQAREQAEAVAGRLNEVGRVEAGDLNQLQSGQHSLREAQRLLTDSPEAAAGQLQALLVELTNSRLVSESLRQRLTHLHEQVQAIGTGPLPAIDQRWNEALKLARDKLADDGSDFAAIASQVADLLKAAKPEHDAAIAQLESLLGDLAEWDSFSRLAREVGEIRSAQERLAADTQALRLASLAADGDATGGARAGARSLAQRQLELARRFDKLQSRMEQLLPRLAHDAVASGTLADALAVARRQAIGGRMREAATSIGEVELGRSVELQTAIAQGLGELLAMLASRRDFELSRTAKALAAASAELDRLRAEAGNIAREAEQAAAEADREAAQRRLQALQKQLETMNQNIAALSRQLQRLRAERPRQAIDAAASAGQRAAAAAGSGDAEAAAKESRQLADQLDAAQEQMAQAQEQTEEQLAREQRMRTEQIVAGLIARQKNVLAELQRIDGARPAKESLPEPMRSELSNLAAEERSLVEETTRLRGQLGSSTAFEFALDGVASQMRRADQLMTQGETGEAAQNAAQDALARLEIILKSLRPADPPPADAAAAEPMPPADSLPPGNLAAAMAEIKLLHALQEQINARTAELHARERQPGDAAELAELAREQGRLADVLLELIPIVESKEEAPTPMPDEAEAAKPLDRLDAELLRDLEQP